MAAPPPILALRGASVTFGGAPLFSGIDAAIGRGDRICLVGPNGGGKSTLLKALTGEIPLDDGDRFQQPGAIIGCLPQAPVFPEGPSVADYVTEGGAEPHRAAAMIEKLSLDPHRAVAQLSGGEGRRAALARALAIDPEILLLDEPTNHLDLPTIEWLENMLTGFRGGLLVISHDRAFLTKVTNATLWLDRGVMHRHDKGYSDFEAWSAQVLAAEESERNRVQQHIKAEARYLHRGVTARRKRNQLRLRKLSDLRQQRAQLLRSDRKAALDASVGEQGGRIVIDAKNLSKAYGDHTIIDDFSTRILRGDRVGLIGPNGAGKTTLLDILIGESEPDSGEVRRGSNITISRFDQQRAALDPDKTLWETLCPAGGDSLMVQGRQRHVVAYLTDFLFDERQARGPVSSLSGGERNRLLLARNLAQPSNVLALDEPTNDLDMDTLDLLEDMLGDYKGTLLLVSHDRDFLDRVVTSVIAVEGDGDIQEYPGGYSDYLHQRPKPEEPAATAKLASKPEGKRRNKSSGRLNFNEKRALETLPVLIDGLTVEIETLEKTLADSELFQRDAKTYNAAASRLDAARAELAAAEEEWLLLEIKQESLSEAS
ncbi:MAG: ATP-binding cassette domain-containing protein [Rhodospirillaceae bacterium]|jgi:ABC transport system ATP-binding/permease protein|nr:ATP-binding cassette domain-containing protein [Rhodospirillaceae bacterium]MBT5664359.1 ATP-binding cassette domain-containing protein [Rhodospirillaceae bacterium]MBT5812077.1 ATP-binding cassette domain-containing protein [Rhodospirillaceae bacterium]